MKENTVELIEFNCAGYLRFILMLFVCFWAFGCPEPSGIVAALSGFAIPAFYILSGYFVLTDDREDRLAKTARKIRRSLLCFGFMFLLYVAVNVVVFILNHMTVAITKRVIFNFVVLNLWPLPVGDNIWFIQALLYAYIVIFIADKLKLMRFYKIIMILLFIVMLLTGELAGIIHFNILGYPYIPGNWLTRALPYLLLGRFIREHRDTLLNLRKWVYIAMFVIGGGLVILEMFILGRTGLLIYQGHMLGFGIMAFGICCLALSIPIMNGNRVVHLDSSISGLIYIFMNPIYYLLALFLAAGHIDFLYYAGGLTAYMASVVIALIIAGMRPAGWLFTNWDQRLADAVNIEEMDD